MLIQYYKLYLCDGNSVEAADTEYIPVQMTLLSRYENAEEDDVIRAQALDGSTVCIPKKNILYLRMTTINETRRNVN